MIARLCGLAADARVATRAARPGPGGGGDPAALAAASRWIAANALAIAGVRVEGAPPLPAGSRVVLGIGARLAFRDLLVALAAAPSLLDARTAPPAWRLALRALGVPTLADAPAAAREVAPPTTLALAADGGAAPGDLPLAVVAPAPAYQVRLAAPPWPRAA